MGFSVTSLAEHFTAVYFKFFSVVIAVHVLYMIL